MLPKGHPLGRNLGFIDRGHYHVGGGLMHHVADPGDPPQRALGNVPVKPGRLSFCVDQLVILAGNDSHGHRQGRVIVVQRKGSGHHESRLGSAGAELRGTKSHLFRKSGELLGDH
jgi:hypothetical protein